MANGGQPKCAYPPCSRRVNTSAHKFLCPACSDILGLIVWYDGLVRYAHEEAQKKEVEKELARDAAEDEARDAAAMDWESGAGLEKAVGYVTAEDAPPSS